MEINRLVAREGIVSIEDTFEKKNLIYSKNNTSGKTTYLKILLYSLGYAIPKAVGLDYSTLETELSLEINKKTFDIYRSGNLLKAIVNKKEELNYQLPDQLYSFLSYLFGCDNLVIIRNLLGVLYIDQDDGWSVFNKGRIMGNYMFDIVELVAALKDISISEYNERINNAEENIRQYKSLKTINAISDSVLKKNNIIYSDNYIDRFENELMLINLRIDETNNKLKEIDEVIKKQVDFFDYLESMTLKVKNPIPNGDPIEVKRNNLLNADETIEFLKARRSLILSDLSDLKKNKERIDSLYKDALDRIQIQNTVDAKDVDVKISRALSKLNEIDLVDVDVLIEKEAKKIETYKNAIRLSARRNNNYVADIHNLFYSYCDELGVGDKITKNTDYIFFRRLGSYSGTVMSKLVFAFRLAVLKTIQTKIGFKLPMLIDSPRSKELNKDSAKEIFDLLNKELSDTQVFVASVYKDFSSDTMIELKQRAIEKRQ